MWETEQMVARMGFNDTDPQKLRFAVGEILTMFLGIASMFREVRRITAKWAHEYGTLLLNEAAAGSLDRFPSDYRAQVVASIIKARTYVVIPGEKRFEVCANDEREIVVTEPGENGIVALPQCSCRLPLLQQRPCSHVCAVLHVLELDPLNFCPEFQTNASMLQLYKNVPEPEEPRDIPSLPHDGTRPPHYAIRPKGRPRKNKRKKSQGEGKQVQCRRCGAFGHRMLGRNGKLRCKNPIPAEWADAFFDRVLDSAAELPADGDMDYSDDEVVTDLTSGVLFPGTEEPDLGSPAKRPKVEPNAGTAWPVTMHQKSGEGRAGFECGWAVLNWIADSLKKPRVEYNTMQAVQAKHAENEAELVDDGSQLQVADAQGWFSLETMSTCVCELTGLGLYHCNDEELAKKAPFLVIGPASSTGNSSGGIFGHWVVAFRSPDGTYVIKDTDREERPAKSYAQLKSWYRKHTFCVSRPH